MRGREDAYSGRLIVLHTLYPPWPTWLIQDVMLRLLALALAAAARDDGEFAHRVLYTADLHSSVVSFAHEHLSALGATLLWRGVDRNHARSRHCVDLRAATAGADAADDPFARDPALRDAYRDADDGERARSAPRLRALSERERFG